MIPRHSSKENVPICSLSFQLWVVSTFLISTMLENVKDFSDNLFKIRAILQIKNFKYANNYLLLFDIFRNHIIINVSQPDLCKSKMLRFHKMYRKVQLISRHNVYNNFPPKGLVLAWNTLSSHGICITIPSWDVSIELSIVQHSETVKHTKKRPIDF